MKLAASLVAVALVASPALAQDNTPSATAAHVHTTTRHIHATNVPVHRVTHHGVIHHRGRHHVMHCTRVSRHGKTYCARTHHVVVKKTVSTTATHS
jgi:hypothetical protein